MTVVRRVIAKQLPMEYRPPEDQLKAHQDRLVDWIRRRRPEILEKVDKYIAEHPLSTTKEIWEENQK